MSNVSVANILADGITEFYKNNKLSYKQKKVVSKIINCRKPQSGIQYLSCSNNACSYSDIQCKPCGDRHCNRCNNYKKLKWINNIIKDLLPIPYHHTIFTIPEELNNLTLYNQPVIYDIFFKASFYVLNKFAEDEKYLGAKIGFIALLHTWGETLNYHPHIHFIVTGGGLKGNHFKSLPYQDKFLFPVEAMSMVFKAKFLEILKRAYQDGKLKFSGKLESISSPNEFRIFINKLYQKGWVIFNKAPLPNADRVLEYISRYTHKIAISNNRIKGYDKDRVAFCFKDYKQRDNKGKPKIKLQLLKREVFIQRFLYHILPEGFRKIRYGGIFSSSLKKSALEKIKDYFIEKITQLDNNKKEYLETIKKYVDMICPECNIGHLSIKYSLDSS